MAGGSDDTWAFVRDALGARFGPLRDEDDGSASGAAGDRRVHAIVLPAGPGDVVQVHTPLVVDVPDSDELCEAVATVELQLGSLLLLPGSDDGQRTVLLAHRLLAAPLRRSQLDVAVDALLADADRLDPELEARFGATWTLERPQ